MLPNARFLATAAVALAVCACGSAGGDSAAAKSHDVERAKNAAPAITGVGGFAWGTPLDTIIARKGAPAGVQDRAEGVKAVMYHDVLLGEKVMLIMFVHPDSGMIRGSYSSITPTAERCVYVLDLFRGAMEKRYAALEHDERAVGESERPPCEEYVSGAGGYAELWTDPANGARIILALAPGAPGVMLNYTTPAADAWEKRKDANRL